LSALEPPEGFCVVEEGEGRLLVDRRLAVELRQAGLLHARSWDRALGCRGEATGRGATARLELPSGARLVLKRLRRGGIVGGLWRDRFPGPRRLLDNLRLPLVALARGVATPRPAALLVVGGPPGLFRGWLAVEEVSDARDLATRFRSSSPPTREELSRVMALVRRMHDAGLEHHDLNLGNLLLRDAAQGADSAWVIDLDGGRLHEGPLPFARRQRALRRLERSHLKLLGGAIRDEAARGWVYDLYAAGDERLAQRLARGRAMGRLWLRLHRLGWPG
jgi:3-deoxy-D-manno-octulosonic acid kinase